MLNGYSAVLNRVLTGYSLTGYPAAGQSLAFILGRYLLRDFVAAQLERFPRWKQARADGDCSYPCGGRSYALWQDCTFVQDCWYPDSDCLYALSRLLSVP